ncbi:MAG: DUF2092 domain-containing protein [Geminicoccaceae bacterium]
MSLANQKLRSPAVTVRSGSRFGLAAIVVLGSLITQPASGQEAPPGAAGRPSPAVLAPSYYLPAQPELEPKAVELMQAMSTTLAAAKTLSFTAVSTYESPARTGQPLAYGSRSDVTLERPDKLRVLTPYDGPPSEFYYDGKTMMAYGPDSGLTAVADAPPTIDAMLEALYRLSATYFPFSDVVVADPWGDLEQGLKLAFVVGQSRVVGSTLTDIVAIADDNVQAQWWIGADDHLPRRIRATFFKEPGDFRHLVELTDWRLDPPLPPGTFASAAAAGAKRIRFAAPGAP